MHRYTNCIAHNSSEGSLLIGAEYTAMFDCGMAFCAEETIQKVENALSGRNLDYIFLSHTHYDHIGALPFFRKKWRQVKAVTSEAGAAVLLKDTPRRVIRELSAVASKTQGIDCNLDYSDDMFQADVIVKDGDIISLGGLSVEIIETPGHTRDALSFYIQELELLILCETTGVLLPDGTVYTCYLTSYDDTVRAIEKCRKIRYKFLSLPHRGVVGSEDAANFFEKAVAATAACRDFILNMKEKGLAEDEILEEVYREYASDMLLTFQPKEAFYANARAIIACTLQEYQQ
jgi:glyoxylase-like metal-dependent hydrolase (beta-lactamase superfamily II)